MYGGVGGGESRRGRKHPSNCGEKACVLAMPRQNRQGCRGYWEVWTSGAFFSSQTV